MFENFRKALIILALFVPVATIAQDFDKIQISGVKAAENIYMLQGQGGNIGLFFGHQGIFIIDDQFAPLHEKIVAKIKEITAGTVPDNSITFIINTHFHRDHTGGNELMGKTGAVIVAHENVRKRLSVEQVMPLFNSRNPAMPESGLPVITFNDDVTFHLNGDSVNVIHVGPAHTDGDAIVHFTKANVIHAGDIVFMQTYPVIDLDNGGSVSGMIKATEQITALSNDQTKIIPGHGNLTDKAGLERYHNMLVTTSKNVSNLVEQGKTLEQIVAAKPTAEFDQEFSGFMTPEKFVGILYRAATTPN